MNLTIIFCSFSFQPISRLLGRYALSIVGSSQTILRAITFVGEWDYEHIVGSVHIPLAELPDRLAEVPRNSNFVILCESGYRSLVAASILERNDFANFSDLAGGYLAWDLTRIEG